MTHAIRFYQTGGPEVMKWEMFDPGMPGPGQVLVRHRAVGLNYIDVYHRNGTYPVSLPATPGMEAAGIVEDVGSGVDDFRPGDRVAYATGPMGAYAESRIMPADRLVHVPQGISDDQAAAMMLQGLTAQYLLRRTYPVKAGDTILVHAAAGGVGLLLCQWAKHLGATVLGTVGSEDKAALALANGCDHAILYRRENFHQRVMELTQGSKVQVVYDSVGRDTFDQSLDCLAPLGMMVSFGQSSGMIPPFDISQLGARGSLFLTRPSLMAYTANRSDLLKGADELFKMVATEKLKVSVRQRYPLKEAVQAHVDLEARKTTGATIFTL